MRKKFLDSLLSSLLFSASKLNRWPFSHRVTHNLLDLLQNPLEIKFINSFIRLLIFNLLFNFSVIYHIILYIIYQIKILTMTYKALNGMAPSNICDLLQLHHLNRNLRSASRGLSLVVPAYET